MKKEENIWHDGAENAIAPKSPGVAGRFNQWFDYLFNLEVPDQVEVRTYAPPYEILETEAHYLMCLDLPGTSRDDLKVEIVGNELVISGQRVCRVPRSSRLPFRGRRRFGLFRRAFILPPSIDEAGIEANCSKGVLEIALPRRKTEKRRQIPVQDRAETFAERYPVFGIGKESSETPELSNLENPLASELDLEELSGSKAA